MLSLRFGKILPMDQLKKTTGTSSGCRLLVVDDHRLYRDSLVMALRSVSHIKGVAVVDGAPQAVKLAQQFCPDVVLMDVTLPLFGAFEAARAIQSGSSIARSLFLDDTIRGVHVRAALRVGGAGYWTKHASLEDITEAIRLVSGGLRTFCPGVQRHLVETPRGLRFRPSTTGTVLDSLSQRELEVLLHLCDGMTVKQCGDRMNLSPRTVDNHKSRLMRKLGLHKIVDLVRLVMREGLLD